VLSITADLKNQAQVAATAVALTVLLFKQCDSERTLELAIGVQRHPAAESAAQVRARQPATELVYRIPRETYQLIETRSISMPLGDMLAESTPSLEPRRSPNRPGASCCCVSLSDRCAHSLPRPWPKKGGPLSAPCR
jgi:hypothetical protein